MSSASSPAVQHQPDADRFEIAMDNASAVLEYKRETGLVIFTHTFVPPALRGKGLAEILVRAALTWAQAEGYKVVPECSYVARFISLHPEYHDLISDNS